MAAAKTGLAVRISAAAELSYVQEDQMETLAELASKIDRLASAEQIRQLPARYALAVDTRDLDTLVSLFIEDVNVGNGEFGREAMKRWWSATLTHFGVSIHLIGNHTFEFDDDDHAHGVVYCRPEHEVQGRWLVVTMQYWDRYERRDGRWYFKSRKPLFWYSRDELENPAGPAKLRWFDRPTAEAPLPGAWPTWHEFWKDRQVP
jgi:hypothetical protein